MFLAVDGPDLEFSVFVIFCADFTIVVSCSSLDSIEATLAAMGLTSLLGWLGTCSPSSKFPPLLCIPNAPPLSLLISAALAALSSCV